MKRNSVNDGGPPAKRHHSEGGVKGEVVDEDQDDKVLTYQKKAIWCRMLEYKREVERAEKRIQLLEERHLEYDSTTTAFARSISEIAEDLKSAMLRFRDATQTNPESLSSALLSLLKQPAAAVNDQALEDWRIAVRDCLDRIVRAVQVGQESNGGKFMMDELQNRCTKLAADNGSLMASIATQRQKIEDLENQLYDSKLAQSNLERKLDKLKFAPAPAAIVSVPGPVATETVQSSSDDSDYYAILAESRLKEIETLKQEKLNLNLMLDELKIQLGLSDEKVRESPLFQNLEAEFQFHKSENEQNKRRMEKLLSDYEDLSSDRRKFVEQVEVEELSRRKTMEAELKKLEGDLARVRANRDSLQQTLELRSAKDEAEIAQNHEIRVIANSRKDRILYLENKIERLKTKAIEIGDGFWHELFSENPEANPLEDLKSRLKASEERVAELEMRLKSFEAASSETVSLQKVLLSEGTLKKELAQLNERADGCSVAAHSALELKIKDLEGKIEYYQKSEARLVAEMQTIGQSWSELEENTLRKVLDLTEKEEQILRLLAEKTKYDQKCAMLIKEKNTSNNLTIALKKQSEKQLEQIRKLEEREKNLVQQLQTIEKEFGGKTLTCDIFRRKVGELQQKLADLQDKFDKLILKNTEIEKELTSRAKQLMDESELKRKAVEQLDVAKRKLDALTKTEHGSDTALQKEVNDYKRKCPKCAIGFAVSDVKQFYL